MVRTPYMPLICCYITIGFGIVLICLALFLRRKYPKLNWIALLAGGVTMILMGVALLVVGKL
jgi:hypothetical protein